jgi:hypothetical protein
MAMTYSSAEKDAVGLCITLEAINGGANHALLTLLDIESLPGQAEVRFQSRTHQQLFLVRLLDLVKEGGDSTLTGVTGSCLDVLKVASENKSFDRNGSVRSLAAATKALDVWLNAETPLLLWLPTLDLNAQLQVSRIEFLNISGNYVKHNISRLTGVAKRIRQILTAHGYDVPLEHIPLALEDFKEHLQEDYFAYYGTWLVELLNNVRWGLQDYLLPTFRWSHARGLGELEYSYKYPDDVVNEVSRAWFWRLMNHVRKGPYLHRFSSPDYMKNEKLR